MRKIKSELSNNKVDIFNFTYNINLTFYRFQYETVECGENGWIIGVTVN